MERKLPTIIEIEKADIPTIYCNHARIAISGIDFTVDMGQALFSRMTLADGDNPPTLPMEAKARIVMSPQFAKILTQLLAQHIEKYENDFGKIETQPKDATATQPKDATKRKKGK